MSDDQTHLHDHSFKIYPRTSINDAPIGIHYIKPAVQDVRVWAPIQHWTFHQVEPHTNKYRLRIKGHHSTGVHEDSVIASVNEEDDEVWEIAYHEFHDAYTIALAKDTTLGWTTPTALAMTDKILLKKLVQTHSNPPQYTARQLYQLRRDD